MDKLAVFELSINDIKLTIFKCTGNGFFAPEQQIVEPVKLTQDMERDGYIKPARIQETISVLKNFRKIVDGAKIENYICYADPTIANARNQIAFLDEIYKTVSLYFKVLTNEERVSALHSAIMYSFAMTRGIIIEIDDYSTQLVRFNRRVVQNSISLPYGMVNLLEKFIESLNDVLKKYDCTLLGGETSELGDLILKNYFDASGFLLGAVKKSDFIDKNNVKSGDIIVGLASSGAHSNGFTLLRKLYSDTVLDENLFTLSLKPVQIYADIVYKLNEKKLIKSCANITGGGILSNLKRALPQGLEPCLDFNSIEKTQLFEKLKELVGVDECFKTFNMGVGFCLVVDKKDLDEVMVLSSDFKPFVLGYVK